MGSGTRLGVVVEDGLGDMYVFFLAERVGGLVLGVVLLHPGQAFTGGQASLFLVLETLCPLQVTFVLVLSFGLVLGLFRVMLPNVRGKDDVVEEGK